MPRTPMPTRAPAGRKPMPSSPTPAERAASKAQDERLKGARVTPKEGRVIESANRSEGGGGMKKGGMAMKKSDKAGRALVKKSADTMGRAMKMNKGGKCYASGGLVAGHKSADGCAVKGKTKGKMV